MKFCLAFFLFAVIYSAAEGHSGSGEGSGESGQREDFPPVFRKFIGHAKLFVFCLLHKNKQSEYKGCEGVTTDSSIEAKHNCISKAFTECEGISPQSGENATMKCIEAMDGFSDKECPRSPLFHHLIGNAEIFGFCLEKSPNPEISEPCKNMTEKTPIEQRKTCLNEEFEKCKTLSMYSNDTEILGCIDDIKAYVKENCPVLAEFSETFVKFFSCIFRKGFNKEKEDCKFLTYFSIKPEYKKCGEAFFPTCKGLDEHSKEDELKTCVKDAREFVNAKCSDKPQ